MLERAQSFELDRDNPGSELLRRMTRVLLVPGLIFSGLRLVFVGFDWHILLGLAPFVLLEVAVPVMVWLSPPRALIDSSGIELVGRRSLRLPWSNVQSVEIGGREDYPLKWLLGLFRVDFRREFVNVGLRSRRLLWTPYKRFPLYLKEPARFVDAANELRGAT